MEKLFTKEIRYPETVGYYEFLAAASRRDFDAMKNALAKGDEKTLFSRDNLGNNVLHYAVFAKPSLETPPF